MNQAGYLPLLREANVKLGRFLENYAGEPVAGSDAEVRALAQLQQVLESVRPILDGPLGSHPDAELRQELASYRRNLERLHGELAAMKTSAESARQQLWFRQNHLQTVKAWCSSVRDLA